MVASKSLGSRRLLVRGELIFIQSDGKGGQLHTTEWPDAPHLHVRIRARTAVPVNTFCDEIISGAVDFVLPSRKITGLSQEAFFPMDRREKEALIATSGVWSP